MVSSTSKAAGRKWEQGRRKPTGAAQTLLPVAHPRMLRELVTG